MDFKLIGSILLVIGTCIGGGMLALPIAMSTLGFVGSILMLVICWFVMTASAFLALEVNLWMPQNSNFVSMAKATIGPLGQIIAWLSYLLLLYSLLCAYIAGGSDLFHNLLQTAGILIPEKAAAILFTLVFGGIVYCGIHLVDYVNRGLMIAKFTAYFVLVILLLPFIDAVKLMTGHLAELTSASAITVTITSFGFATIVPSIRIYLNGHVQKLKLAIFIGSLIPLVCYILWDMAIMGVIPLGGDHGLMAILHSKTSTSDLVNTLSAVVSHGSVTFFAKLFTSVCVLTSFLGVALCMNDFLADGLHIEKQGINRLFIQLVALLPPLVLVLFFPSIFIKALEYAGIYCVILLSLLPAWMAWRGRYHRRIARGFMVIGGRPLLAGIILFSVVILIRSLTG